MTERGSDVSLILESEGASDASEPLQQPSRPLPVDAPRFSFVKHARQSSSGPLSELLSAPSGDRLQSEGTMDGMIQKTHSLPASHRSQPAPSLRPEEPPTQQSKSQRVAYITTSPAKGVADGVPRPPPTTPAQHLMADPHSASVPTSLYHLSQPTASQPASTQLGAIPVQVTAVAAHDRSEGHFASTALQHGGVPVMALSRRGGGRVAGPAATRGSTAMSMSLSLDGPHRNRSGMFTSRSATTGAEPGRTPQNTQELHHLWVDPDQSTAAPTSYVLMKQNADGSLLQMSEAEVASTLRQATAPQHSATDPGALSLLTSGKATQTAATATAFATRQDVGGSDSRDLHAMSSRVSSAYEDSFEYEPEQLASSRLTAKPPPPTKVVYVPVNAVAISTEVVPSKLSSADPTSSALTTKSPRSAAAPLPPPAPAASVGKTLPTKSAPQSVASEAPSREVTSAAAPAPSQEAPKPEGATRSPLRLREPTVGDEARAAVVPVQAGRDCSPWRLRRGEGGALVVHGLREQVEAALRLEEDALVVLGYADQLLALGRCEAAAAQYAAAAHHVLAAIEVTAALGRGCAPAEVYHPTLRRLMSTLDVIDAATAALANTPHLPAPAAAPLLRAPPQSPRNVSPRRLDPAPPTLALQHLHLQAAEQRIAAERLANEQRLAAEQRIAAERLANEQRLAAEQRIAAECLANEQRLAAEQRIANEQRFAAGQRIAAAAQADLVIDPAIPTPPVPLRPPAVSTPAYPQSPAPLAAPHGTVLRPLPAAAPPDTAPALLAAFCSSCGSPHAPGARFCPMCGTHVPQTQPRDLSPPRARAAYHQRWPQHV